MYNILTLKLKSIFRTVTKEILQALKIMILGFILIIAMLVIKYKPVYEVTIAKETLGYIENREEFAKTIEEQIISKQGQNIDNVSLEQEPEYEIKLIGRSKETNENQIIAKLEQTAITTYKFYEVALNEKNKTYVDTLEEAEKVVEEIKLEHDEDGLELNLVITEKYTQKLEEVKTETIEVAELSFEDEIKQLLDEKEAKEAIATINGINLAVLPVSSGRITSRYGERSSIRVSTHTGLDIACSKGTDIKAVAKGKIVFAQRNGAYGNLVKIDHGNGVKTWYAHCSKIYASIGDEVSPGDVIATVGSTGNSTGPHLHLEIRINDVAVNPQKYLYKK